MNTLLPVLLSNSAPMSLCSICPEPGHCCRKFYLPECPTFWATNWREQAQAWLDEYHLPYLIHSCETYRDEESGEDYVLVWFGCGHVTDKGLCGIYETRPNICREFLPASDNLCVFYTMRST